MSEPTVLVETRSNGARWITLNRPDQLNTISEKLAAELAEALRAAAADEAVRCVVLTGAGRAFCAGGDITEFREAEPWEAFGPAIDLTGPLQDSGKIFVAAINGPAAGGAFGLIANADLRLASDAANFTPGFMGLAIVPDIGSTALAREIGYSRALTFLLLGHKVSAEEAHAMGLVNHVWPAAEFVERTRAFVDAICDLPPLAVAETKRLLKLRATRSPIEVLWEEALAAARLLSTEDHQEGVRAFVERRKPVFRGR